MTAGNLPNHEERLHAAIADYRARRLSGERVDRGAFFRSHADLATELAPHLDAVDRAAAPTGLQPTIATQNQTTALADLPGCRIFGDYELLEELARGGMGVVYRARQRSLGRTVAVKMILGGRLASPSDVQRFRAEAGAAAALDHPHIVPIYEIGELEGQHYFSMKLIEGGSLAEWIGSVPVPATPHAGSSTAASRGVLTPPPSWSTATIQRKQFAARVVASAARAVHYAHQRGVLHRDIKPANILLASDGQPQVTDFGLAKLIEDDSGLTATGAILGTPGYMAPEQAAGKRGSTTVATDVYALGVVLYEVLTGRTPFRAATPLETLRKVVENEPPPPRQFEPTVDADLETIVLKCLEKQPDRRYGSAALLADDLSRWLAGEPIVARPTTGWERVRKWARRRPAAAALLGVSAASALALLILGGVLWRNAEQRAQTVSDLEVAQDELKKAGRELEHAQQEREGLVRSADELRQESAKLSTALVDGGHELDRFRNLSRLTGYAADMQLARAAAENDNLARLLDLLDRHRPAPGEADVRGLEWRFLWRFAHGNLRGWQVRPRRERLTTLDGSPIQLAAQSLVIALSGDGKRVACAIGDGQVKIWGVDHSTDMRSLKVPPGPVVQLAFSPDDAHLAIVQPSNKQVSTLSILAAVVGLSEPRVDALADALRVRWIPIETDGALASESTEPDAEAAGVRALDLANPHDPAAIALMAGDAAFIGHEIMLESQALVPTYLAVNADRTMAAVCGLVVPMSGPGASDSVYRGGVLLWNVPNHRITRFIGGFDSPLMAAAFGKDGQVLAVAGYDHSIRLLGVEDGESQAVLTGHAAPVLSLAYSPSDDRLASGDGNGIVKIWEMEPGHRSSTLRGHLSQVSALAFLPGGDRLVTGSPDGEVKLWDTRRQSMPASAEMGKHKVRAIALDEAADRVLSLDEGGNLLQAPTANLAFEPVGKPLGQTALAVFSGDGKQMAWVEQRFFGQRLQIAGTEPGAPRIAPKNQDGSILSLAFAPSGRYLAASTIGQKVMVWNTQTGELLASLPEQPTPMSALAFSPDEQHLACGGKAHDRSEASGPMLLWPWAQQQQPLLLAQRPGAVRCLAFAPDGRLAAARDDLVQIWRARDAHWSDGFAADPAVPHDAAWEVELSLRTYAQFVSQLDFSPDGKRLLTACQPSELQGGGSSLQLWDTSTGQEVLNWGQPQEVATHFAGCASGGKLVAVFEQNGFYSLESAASVVRLYDASALAEEAIPLAPARAMKR